MSETGSSLVLHFGGSNCGDPYLILACGDLYDPDHISVENRVISRIALFQGRG